MRSAKERSDKRAISRLHVRARNVERRSPGPWHYVGETGEPAFTNGTNTGGDLTHLRFRKTLGAGLEIQGSVTGLSPGDVIFTLPAGYRPTKELRLAASDDAGGFVVFRVLADGDVVYGIT